MHENSTNCSSAGSVVVSYDARKKIDHRATERREDYCGRVIVYGTRYM